MDLPVLSGDWQFLVESSTASCSVSTASASIMDRNYLCHTSGLSDLSVVKLWRSFMSGALSSPWGTSFSNAIQGHRGPRSTGAPRPCASQLPSVRANYSLVLWTILFVPDSLIKLLENFQFCLQDRNLAQLSSS